LRIKKKEKEEEREKERLLPPAGEESYRYGKTMLD
jgi:hypothetical protein